MRVANERVLREHQLALLYSTASISRLAPKVRHMSSENLKLQHIVQPYYTRWEAASALSDEGSLTRQALLALAYRRAKADMREGDMLGVAFEFAELESEFVEDKPEAVHRSSGNAASDGTQIEGTWQAIVSPQNAQAAPSKSRKKAPANVSDVQPTASGYQTLASRLDLLLASISSIVGDSERKDGWRREIDNLVQTELQEPDSSGNLTHVFWSQEVPCYLVPKGLRDNSGIKEQSIYSCDNRRWDEQFGANPDKPRPVPQFRTIGTFTPLAHMLSSLWVLMVGRRLDAVVRRDSYGCRLRRINLRARRKGSVAPLHTGRSASFEPYVPAYKRWRADGNAAMRAQLEVGKTVTAISLDLKSFYHSVELTRLLGLAEDGSISPLYKHPRLLRRPAHVRAEEEGNNLCFVGEVDGNRYEMTEFEAGFTHFIVRVLDEWSKQARAYLQSIVGSMTGQLTAVVGQAINTADVPIGLPLQLGISKILANYVLDEWDSFVVNELCPLYYGRYVDDTFIVVSEDEQVDHTSNRNTGHLRDGTSAEPSEKVVAAGKHADESDPGNSTCDCRDASVRPSARVLWITERLKEYKARLLGRSGDAEAGSRDAAMAGWLPRPSGVDDAVAGDAGKPAQQGELGTSLSFNAAKVREYRLSGASGLNLLDVLDVEFERLSSANSLMPESADVGSSLASRVLSGGVDRGDNSSNIRHVESVSVKRLAFSLLLREGELKSRLLPMGMLPQDRNNYFAFATDHLLTPFALFSHWNQLARLLRLAYRDDSSGIHIWQLVDAVHASLAKWFLSGRMVDGGHSGASGQRNASEQVSPDIPVTPQLEIGIPNGVEQASPVEVDMPASLQADDGVPHVHVEINGVEHRLDSSGQRNVSSLLMKLLKNLLVDSIQRQWGADELQARLVPTDGGLTVRIFQPSCAESVYTLKALELLAGVGRTDSTALLLLARRNAGALILADLHSKGLWEWILNAVPSLEGCDSDQDAVDANCLARLGARDGRLALGVVWENSFPANADRDSDRLNCLALVEVLQVLAQSRPPTGPAMHLTALDGDAQMQNQRDRSAPNGVGVAVRGFPLSQWQLQRTLVLTIRPPGSAILSERMHELEPGSFSFSRFASLTAATSGTYVSSGLEDPNLGSRQRCGANDLGAAIFVNVARQRPASHLPRVAVVSVSTSDSEWHAAAADRPNTSLERFLRLGRAANSVLSSWPRPDYVVFPELAIPNAWVREFAAMLGRRGISSVFGVEYTAVPHCDASNEKQSERHPVVALRGLVQNAAYVSLLEDRLDHPCRLGFLQRKLFPAAAEREALLTVHGRTFEPVPDRNLPTIYRHAGFAFGVMICSELISSRLRARFQGKVDAILVPAWNRDRESFDALATSTAIDVHCAVCVANVRQYGGTRVLWPASKRHERELGALSGGLTDGFVVCELDVHRLREFQSRAYSNGESGFKPVPSDFEVAGYRKAVPK